ncbi:MAG TPA: hypothetical protein VF179_01535 [Thermoanaerobaculia bacterium]|nr:hypothetical protein [Thermoanaerobaculia bacterium]
MTRPARCRWMLTVLCGCAAVFLIARPDAEAGKPGGRRVLFIGNSFTYSNDLPSIIEALAAATGQERFLHEEVVYGGYSLEDHWNDGQAMKAIAKGGWEIVVMQHGPSAWEGRPTMYEYAPRFAKEIRRVGARPALYMVWPEKDRLDDLDRCSQTYRTAAEMIDGLLFPGGEAWQEAWKLDPKLPLYSFDDLHPSKTGSYLVALVMYEQIYRKSPIGLPSQLKLRDGTKLKIPAQQARLLQQAAVEANKRFARQ